MLLLLRSTVTQVLKGSLSMKKSDENRYPHSADLFKFCKEALNIKHNFEVKVIDQHVGAILGYDPADCSHWKKGKKNIKSLQTINTIATHLDVDPRFVTDIISGKMDLEESLQEYRGYGAFSLSSKYYEELKREFFRNPTRFAPVGGSEPKSFDQVIDLNRDESLKLTTQILKKADIRSCPVLIPELLASLPNIELSEEELPSETKVATTFANGIYTIKVRKGEMRPHLRFLIAREIGRIHLYPTLAEQDADEIVAARINHFASLLLVPSDLLQIVTKQADHTRDLVQQLSEMFWVSRLIVNIRLKDFLALGN